MLKEVNGMISLEKVIWKNPADKVIDKEQNEVQRFMNYNCITICCAGGGGTVRPIYQSAGRCY